PAEREVAEPHRLQDDEAVPEASPLGDGTIAPMGGLWSTIRDLTRWVGFFTDAFPPRDGLDDGPLPRWARREMQQLRRVEELARVRPSPDGPSRVAVTGYGLGLGVRIDERLGVSVGHSGGLPGYGSHMRSLPERGVGVVALSNVTYGNMHGACLEAIEVLADLDELGPAHEVAPAPSLSHAASRAVALLSAWNDADAHALFASNVALDETLARRAATAGRIVARHGPLDDASLELSTPMRGALSSRAGSVRVEIGLNHARRVQWLDIEDRTVPSRLPIAVDRELLRETSGIAYVIVRPVAAVHEEFMRWQGQALDRLGGAPASAPSAHVTLKAFGASGSPLTAEDHARIAALVGAWAEGRAPIELRPERLGVFDEDGAIPFVGLAPTDTLMTAMRDLWQRAASAGLPAGYSDAIGLRAWIPHLSLAYVRELPASGWEEFLAWVAATEPGDVACVVHEAELVAYDETGELRLGVFPLGGEL
ncbi:MAG TPA: serine hydrolase, partial [Actinomycetota bacterium]|nr:serine hydrolase [Actinomycetota bacterium]